MQGVSGPDPGGTQENAGGGSGGRARSGIQI